MEHPTESLVRAWNGDRAISLRSAGGDEGDGNTLAGHFAVFDRWTEIDSPYEGHFLERVASSAFERAFATQRERVKVLFSHGKDPSIGNKPIGVPTVMENRDGGAYYEVDLFGESSFVADLKPGLRAGVYGASFRFGVPKDGELWNDKPERGAHNPTGLPERTLTSVDLYEFGPTPWGAYPEASAGLRSLTDDFVEQMLNDPLFVARLVERAGLKNIEPLIERARAADAEADEQQEETEEPGAARESVTTTLAERRAFMARLITAKD